MDSRVREQYLAHWGVKGMKWGQRRYQKEDGSLTEEGKKRYDKQMEVDRSQLKKQTKKSFIDKTIDRSTNNTIGLFAMWGLSSIAVKTIKNKNSKAYMYFNMFKKSAPFGIAMNLPVAAIGHASRLIKKKVDETKD